MSVRGVSEPDSRILPGPGRAIERDPAGVTAFVGRTLKGPVAQPVPIRSFSRLSADLRRPLATVLAVLRRRAVFRKWWPRSGHRARRQRRALPRPSRCPPAAVHCGLRPSIRARANTCAPRSTTTASARTIASISSCSVWPSPASEQVQDQEILRNLSTEPGSARFVADVMQSSALARVAGRGAAGAPGSHRRGTGRGRGRVRGRQCRWR